MINFYKIASKKSKKYFDFLKGEEKYKFNFGGEVHQLYDLKIKV